MLSRDQVGLWLLQDIATEKLPFLVPIPLSCLRLQEENHQNPGQMSSPAPPCI